MSGETANGLRITGIEFINCSSCVYFGGSSQGTKNLRVDNCKHTADNDTDIFIHTNADVSGVADNNDFLNSRAFYLFFDNDSSQTYPFDVGDDVSSNDNIIFIEDNDFTVDSGCPNHGIVGNLAARAVIRYNVFDYTSSGCGWTNIIDAHDSYENYPDRGTLGYEIYSNQFKVQAGGERVIHLRGGLHIVYDNHVNLDLSWPVTINPYNCVNYWDGSECDDQSGSGNAYDDDDAALTSCDDQPNHSYFWDNKDNCGGDTVTCGSGSSFNPTNDTPNCTILNTHFYNSEKGGYSPYTYPHPLRGDAPSNKSYMYGVTMSGITIQ
jgi:hypothetical protein